MIKLRDPKEWNKFIRIKRYENLPEMALDSVELYKERNAFRWFAEDGETLNAMTYDEFGKVMKDIF